jgi:hypothetical protein
MFTSGDNNRSVDETNKCSLPTDSSGYCRSYNDQCYKDTSCPLFTKALSNTDEEILLCSKIECDKRIPESNGNCLILGEEEEIGSCVSFEKKCYSNCPDSTFLSDNKLLCIKTECDETTSPSSSDTETNEKCILDECKKYSITECKKHNNCNIINGSCISLKNGSINGNISGSVVGGFLYPYVYINLKKKKNKKTKSKKKKNINFYYKFLNYI